MRKKISFLLAVLLVVLLCGCSSGKITGLDQYRPETCSLELTEYLFPSSDFLSAFPYTSGDYTYSYDDFALDGGYAAALAWLRYSPEIYQEAKAYCMEQFEICDLHQFTHDGFTFSEHLCHFVMNESEELVVGCDYPRWFNMFGYNDETCTLIFLGNYNNNNQETETAQTDFGVYLEQFYSEYIGKEGQ